MAKYISRAAIAAAALALGVSGAYAAGTLGDNIDLHVSVTVVTSCNIISVAPIVFTDIAAAAHTTEEIKSSAVVVNCNNGAWSLSPATEIDGDVRTMKSGGATLNYKLCNPNPGTYSNCSALKLSAPLTGSAFSDTKYIFAVMQGDQLPAKSGNYSDVVSIQLTN